MIDSRDKRASAIGGGLLFRVVFGGPDTLIGAGDRQQALGLYRAILAISDGGGGVSGAISPVATLIDTASPVATLSTGISPVANLL